MSLNTYFRGVRETHLKLLFPTALYQRTTWKQGRRKVRVFFRCSFHEGQSIAVTYTSLFVVQNPCSASGGIHLNGNLVCGESAMIK